MFIIPLHLEDKLRELKYNVYFGFKVHFVTIFEMCDYRRGRDWLLGLLTTCMHHSEL
jgi:hypothetical protein